MEGNGTINGTKRSSLKMNILSLFTHLHDLCFFLLWDSKGEYFKVFFCPCN